MKIFNSVSDLQAASLTAGQLTQTKRYFAGQDGGGATYLIKTAVDYAGTPDEYGDHTLANGNVAVLQTEGSVNVKQFGATGDGTTDDTASIQAAVSSLPNRGGSTYKGGDLFIPSGEYKTSSTITFPTNSPTHAYISVKGEGSSSHIEWAGGTDDPMFYFPHSSDRMHIFIDMINMRGETVSTDVYRGIPIRIGTPSNPSGFAINFSVTRCKFNKSSICIDAHGEADNVTIDNNYIGSFSTAGVKYSQPNNSGWRVTGNHFRGGAQTATCILGDATGNGFNWVISNNILQSASGMGIVSLESITGVQLINNYAENSGASDAGDKTPFSFNNCNNVVIEGCLTTGRTGSSAIYRLTGTGAGFKIGNNFHSVSAMVPNSHYYISANSTNVTVLGDLSYTTGYTIKIFETGSTTTNVIRSYRQTTPSGEDYYRTYSPTAEVITLQNAAASGGTITLKTVSDSPQAYHVYAFNSVNNYWSYGVVARTGTGNALAYNSLFEKNSALAISVSGNDIIVTNGAGGVRTIEYSLVRIY